MSRRDRRAAASAGRKKTGGSKSEAADVLRVAAEVRSAQSRTTQEILGEGKTPEKLLEVAANAQHWAQELYDEAPGSLSGLACKDGCAWCCHQRVDVSAVEVLRIIHHLSDGPHLDGVLARALAVEASTAGQRWDERPPTACPLLAERRCLAYEVRPLACRGFNALDVEPCRGWVEGRDAGNVTIDVLRRQACLSVLEGMSDAIAKSGFESDTLDLAIALRIALERGPEVVDEWLSGARPFAQAHVPSGQPSGIGHRRLPVVKE